MKERRAQIEEVVRPAIMGVLVSLYESGLVHKVNMADILKLFGLNGKQIEGMESSIIDFNSPGFQSDYLAYQEKLLNQNINETDSDTKRKSNQAKIKKTKEVAKEIDFDAIEEFYKQTINGKTIH